LSSTSSFYIFTDGAIGAANSILILKRRESYGRVTQLHISQLGLLSVFSAPLQGNKRGQKGRLRRSGKRSGRETEGDKYGKYVSEARL